MNLVCRVLLFLLICRVFFLDIPNDAVVERLSLLSTDPITGDRYHLLYHPPRTPEVKSRLVVNPRDAEDTVRRRLAAFRAVAGDLEDFYTNALHINAEQDEHHVFEMIESMIVNPLPKCKPTASK